MKETRMQEERDTEWERPLRSICNDCLCRWLLCPSADQRCIHVVLFSTSLDTPGRYLMQNFPKVITQAEID